MITIEVEFAMPTPIGYADRVEVTHSEYRDASMHIEEHVQWLKKVFHSKAVRHPMVTFNYHSEERDRNIGTARIIDEYDGTYRILTWDDWGKITSDSKVKKVDVRLLRKLYAHNVDRQLVFQTKLDREGVK